MPPFKMAFPVKMYGRFDGTDAKGRDIHFEDDLFDGQMIGHFRKTNYPDPAPPWGRVEIQANGEVWIVDGSDYCPRCAKAKGTDTGCACGRCHDCWAPAPSAQPVQVPCITLVFS